MPPAVRKGALVPPGAAQAGSKAVGGSGPVLPSPRSAEAGLRFSSCVGSAMGNLEGSWDGGCRGWVIAHPQPDAATPAALPPALRGGRD